jgi:hypothetical protein
MGLRQLRRRCQLHGPVIAANRISSAQILHSQDAVAAGPEGMRRGKGGRS